MLDKPGLAKDLRCMRHAHEACMLSSVWHLADRFPSSQSAWPFKLRILEPQQWGIVVEICGHS